MVEMKQNTVQDLEHIAIVLIHQLWQRDRNLSFSMLIWKHPLFDPM